MLIEDDSGFVDLVAFDKEAEHLLKYTVKEFTELEAQVIFCISQLSYKINFLYFF